MSERPPFDESDAKRSDRSVGSIRSDLRVVGRWFLLTRAIVLAAAIAGDAHRKAGFQYQALGGVEPPRWLRPFVRWDSAFYLDLARNGYPPPRAGPVFHAAFFPLYPLVVRALDLAVRNTVLTSMIVSNLCAFAAALLICRLARVTGGAHARQAAILFLASPGADFLSFPYSEGLFCLLATAGLLATLRDRPWTAAACGALASATRPTGIVVGIGLVVRGLERRAWADYAAAALSTAGLVAFALFCRHRYGDALYFSHIQAAWHREASLLGPVKALFGFQFDPDYYLVTIVAVGAAVWMLRRSEAVLSITAWFLVLLPLSTGTLKSMIRFQGANMPLLAGAAPALSRRWLRVAVGLSLLLLAYETFEYSAGFAHN